MVPITRITLSKGGGMQAWRMGRSKVETSRGPRVSENPGYSSSKEWCEPIPPKALGFLANVHQARVSR